MKVKHKIYDLRIAAFHVAGQELMARSFGLNSLVKIWPVENPGPDDRTWRASIEYDGQWVTAKGHRMICLAGWLAETILRDEVSKQEINAWLADPCDLARDLVDALEANDFSASASRGLQGWTLEELVDVLGFLKRYRSLLEVEAKVWIARALAGPVAA